MPWYDIEHAIPLSPAQCDALAEKITYLHTRIFTVPALLVNVQFRDSSKDNTYVAGKRKLSSRIQANLRVGPGRPVHMYDDLAEQLEKAWYEVVGTGKDKELRAVLINGGRLTGREAGFVISPASGIGKEVSVHVWNVLNCELNPNRQPMLRIGLSRTCQRSRGEQTMVMRRCGICWRRWFRGMI